MNKGVHITHNDGDAIGCALVASFFFPNLHFEKDTRFTAIGTQDNAVSSLIEEIEQAHQNNEEIPKVIFVSDIGLSKESYDMLYSLQLKYNIIVRCFDHHVTNKFNHYNGISFTNDCLMGEIYNIQVNNKFDLYQIYDGDFNERITSACWDMLYICLATIQSDKFFDFLPEELEHEIIEVEGRFMDIFEYLNFHSSKILYRLLYLIADISDYDVWNWKKCPRPRTYKITNLVSTSAEVCFEGDESVNEDFVKCICGFMGPQTTYEILFKYYKQIENVEELNRIEKGFSEESFVAPIELLTVYNSIQKAISSSIERMKSKVKISKFNEYIVAIFIQEDPYFNELSDYLLTNYSWIDIVFTLYPASKRVGLRTKANDINVSRLAKRYFNGGGHVQASGGSVSSDSMIHMIKHMYYSGMDLSEINIDDEYSGDLYEDLYIHNY